MACGCRGRSLGRELVAQGWSVRGTSRDQAGLTAIEEAGIEPALADPDRPGTLLDLVADVTVVYWLLATAQDEPEVIAAIHGPRLERLLEKLVDTPVRGFVYEAAGSVQDHRLRHGAGLVKEAGERWHIPYALVEADPSSHEAWMSEMVGATTGLLDR